MNVNSPGLETDNKQNKKQNRKTLETGIVI